MAPSSPPWRIVSAHGTLHIVQSEAALKQLSSAHRLEERYMRNLVGLLPSEPRGSHKNWQLLAKVRWLQSERTGEHVIVVGGAKNFLETVGARADMDFKCKREMERFLSGKMLNRETGVARETYKGWRLVPEPAIVRSLPDGASLASIFAAGGPGGGAASAVPPPEERVPQGATAAATQPPPQAMHPMAWAQQHGGSAGAFGCCEGAGHFACSGGTYGAAEVACAIKSAAQVTAHTYECVLEQEREQAEQRAAHLEAEVRIKNMQKAPGRSRKFSPNASRFAAPPPCALSRELEQTLFWSF